MSVLKYIYREEMAREVIELASIGRSMVQIAAEWGISKDAMKDWARDKNKPEFMLAYKVARTCNEGYWEDLGQKGAKGLLPKFNVAAWSRLMSARFKDDWTETSKQKVEMKNEFKSMSDKEIDEALKLLLEQKKANQINETP